MMITGNSKAQKALRVSLSRSFIGTAGSTATSSLRATMYQVPMIATPIRMPGTMPARNSLAIETCPATPSRIMPIDGGITGAMMPPAAIRPPERGRS